MLWKWRTRQVNYKDSGYDVLAVSATFDSSQGTLGFLPAQQLGTYWGTGTGQFPYEYRSTSKDFWDLVEQYTPIAIMSFARVEMNSGFGTDKRWILGDFARNLARTRKYDAIPPQTSYGWLPILPYVGSDSVLRWHKFCPPYPGGADDDFSPYNGTGVQDILDEPPDPTQDAETPTQPHRRSSSLPLQPIVDAIEDEFQAGEIVPSIQSSSGTLGATIAEYIAYHVAWYRHYSVNIKYPDDPSKQCLKAGHASVGEAVSATDAEIAVDIQIDELLKVLP